MTHANTQNSINNDLEAAQRSETEAKISGLHKMADMLQSFAAQSKRKLSRGKALEQASILAGFKDYQTAKALIEEAGENQLAWNKYHWEVVLKQGNKQRTGETKVVPTTGEIKPWEANRGFVNGQFLITQGEEHLSIKLHRTGEPESALEVLLEMDADMPRLTVYRPEVCDSPIFSVHADKPGVVLQYMHDDDQMYHKNRADTVGSEMIKKVAHASKGVWFVPTPAEN